MSCIIVETKVKCEKVMHLPLLIHAQPNKALQEFAQHRKGRITEIETAETKML